MALTAAASTTTGGTTSTTFTVPNAPPDYGGSLFVSDLASGLYVTVTPVAPLPTRPILVPVQGSGVDRRDDRRVGKCDSDRHRRQHDRWHRNDFGGRIIRVLPNGTVNTFAYGFDTNGAQDFIELHQLDALASASRRTGRRSTPPTITGIWQFKTTADLADSTSGTLVGLNDLRTLGVPYDGQNSAVAVVDTGVDAHRLRSAAESRRAPTSSPAGWATRTSRRRRRPRRPPVAAAPAAAVGRRNRRHQRPGELRSAATARRSRA